MVIHSDNLQKVGYCAEMLRCGHFMPVNYTQVSIHLKFTNNLRTLIILQQLLCIQPLTPAMLKCITKGRGCSVLNIVLECTTRLVFFCYRNPIQYKNMFKPTHLKNGAVKTARNQIGELQQFAV